jgi:hypothetical protein
MSADKVLGSYPGRGMLFSVADMNIDEQASFGDIWLLRPPA